MSPAERYRAAGGDLDALERAKARIATAVASTRTDLARGLVGAFGGMVRLPMGVQDPTLVMSTDGVGTKVLVALRAGRHDTVGEDLVNHCVNDILVHGARPIAFLDYIAGAHVPTDTLVALVEGVARGCRAHGMTLVGGETAQLPDLYEPGHYDLAGTIVGVVAEREALHGDRVAAGDVLIGYASSGLHTNGYSLARRILLDDLRLGIDAEVTELSGRVSDVLLAVHRSYWEAVHPVLPRVHALAHVTGGGIPGNLVRVLPQDIGAVVRKSAWAVPPLFSFLQHAGHVSDDEMYRVFNMGVGMIAVVAPGDADAVREAAHRANVETWVIGEITRGHGVALA
ncbi:MAG: phosphoribosylformylglycinamidine cyclo-ligase [Gemmatimonadetes bacterium RIFCSPLOWO2_12_FULL_68_9]|nr:MAG: phosphoribosylformylglycinamidine cyclo-ligase [Gemmatimonadetes bacterium RIFCSPLOWO2_12_FULL_68_9]